jgi:hypothetical protein
MSRRALVLAGLSLALGLSACGGPSGPQAALLGEWALNPGADCPIDHMTFTARSTTEHVIAIGPNPPSQSTHAVSYAWEAPNKAIVQGQGTGAGAAIYVMTDHDHIYAGDNEACAYTRAG